MVTAPACVMAPMTLYISFHTPLDAAPTLLYGAIHTESAISCHYRETGKQIMQHQEKSMFAHTLVTAISRLATLLLSAFSIFY